jgi:hypothetical protein
MAGIIKQIDQYEDSLSKHEFRQKAIDGLMTPE